MPAIFSSGEFGSKLSSDPVRKETQQKIAGARLRKLQNEIDSGIRTKGSKEVREILNELEKKGIATFGTGLRGRFDVAGGGDKSYTRSQLGRLRGALYDPSQRDFDKAGTQVAGQELSAADYENYLKGREERFRDTLLGKGIATLGGMFNPLGSAVKGAQDFLSPYLKFLQPEKPDYYSLLQPGQNEENNQNMHAGIFSLPVRQNLSSGTANVPIAPLSGFQLASNTVNYENPVVNASNIINSNQLYPMLNYNYPIV
jgi:hypothetical protein